MEIYSNNNWPTSKAVQEFAVCQMKLVGYLAYLGRGGGDKLQLSNYVFDKIRQIKVRTTHPEFERDSFIRNEEDRKREKGGPHIFQNTLAEGKET